MEGGPAPTGCCVTWRTTSPTSAGGEVLRDGAERIVKASEMAKAEVGVRVKLLSDPNALDGVRGTGSTRTSPTSSGGSTRRWRCR